MLIIYKNKQNCEHMIVIVCIYIYTCQAQTILKTSNNLENLFTAWMQRTSDKYIELLNPQRNETDVILPLWVLSTSLSSCVKAVEPIFGRGMRNCHGLVFTYLCLVLILSQGF